jgi:hypothetical protein
MALKITMTMVVEDEGILCDPVSLKTDFGNDWLQLVQFMAKEEGKLFLPCEWPDRIEYVSAELVSQTPQGGDHESLPAPEGSKP